MQIKPEEFNPILPVHVNLLKELIKPELLPTPPQLQNLPFGFYNYQNLISPYEKRHYIRAFQKRIEFDIMRDKLKIEQYKYKSRLEQLKCFEKKSISELFNHHDKIENNALNFEYSKTPLHTEQKNLILPKITHKIKFITPQALRHSSNLDLNDCL